MLTIKEIVIKINQGISYKNAENLIRSKVELEVQAALKAATRKAKIIDDPNSYTGNTGSEYPPDQIISEKSILSAYPLKNIL